MPWEKILPAATLAVKISFNRSINTSPYIFRKAQLPNFEIYKEYQVENFIVDHKALLEK